MVPVPFLPLVQTEKPLNQKIQKLVSFKNESDVSEPKNYVLYYKQIFYCRNQKSPAIRPAFKNQKKLIYGHQKTCLIEQGDQVIQNYVLRIWSPFYFISTTDKKV